MNENLYDTVIIGGGPAGYTAALYCARSGLSVLVLEKMTPGGQMASTGQVDNYPGFDEGIDGFTLGERMRKSAERFGAQTRFAEVTAVDLHAQPKRLTTADGDILAQTVIAATGAYPRELGLPEEASLRGRGVSYCAACDGMLYKDKSVVVAGGGNSAAEDALYLARLCRKVYLVHRRDNLRAAAVYRRALQDSAVEFLWNCRIAEILHDERVTGVQLEDVHTGDRRALACDGVFVAIGRVPDTALFRSQLAVDDAGCLCADETTRTGIPGVFAVGDVRTKPLRQIVTAAADGAVASRYVEEYLLQTQLQ